MRQLIFILCLTGSVTCFSQARVDSLVQPALPLGFLFANAQVLKTDSGIYVTQFIKTGCKDYFTETNFFPAPQFVVATQKMSFVPTTPLPRKKEKFLEIHGNVSYDFFYRSAIDTPVNQRDFRQHTERVNLNLLVKEKYPLKLSFTARQSNSPYFRNFFDPNLLFDKFSYNKNLKQALLNRLMVEMPERPDLKLNEAALREELDRYSRLKKWLESPVTLQKIIEEKERGLGKKQGKNSNITGLTQKINLDSAMASTSSRKDSLFSRMNHIKEGADSLKGDFIGRYETERRKLDSLGGRIKLLQKRVDSIKGAVQKQIVQAKNMISKATSQKELTKIAETYGVKPDQKAKFEKQLSAIRNFSIGRSILNYTELTAQNITITGINVEYNPSYYAAIAAGKIDFRFRDFYNGNARGNNRNNQYIVMGRIGLGNIERKALIFSLFQGRKNTAGYSLSDSVKNYVNILGYSVEAIYRVDENTSLSAEFAKSTKPTSGNLQSDKQTKTLWSYNDKSNMGINIKAQTSIPQTNTRLSGFFRKTGESFQSFSLFSYNTDQTAWLMRFDQPFLKNRISLTGMLRRNDFTNPFTDKTFKTSTVFKTVLLNVRIPKYPAISIGYYPGTQLYIVNNERIRENAYYILNASLIYSYFFRNIGMNTSVIYNRYTNQASDSGFVLYRGVNYYASQSVFLKKLNLQGGYSYTKQPELEFYTMEASGDYSFKKIFRFGIGAKYNKVNTGDHYWGGRAQLTADLKFFGVFQFQYEKSYLPTIKQTLYPVEIGRVSYYKYF